MCEAVFIGKKVGYAAQCSCKNKSERETASTSLRDKDLCVCVYACTYGSQNSPVLLLKQQRQALEVECIYLDEDGMTSASLRHSKVQRSAFYCSTFTFR